MKEHQWIRSRNKNLSVMIQKSNAPSNKPVIIHCHGFTGDKVGANRLHINLANALVGHGFGMVRFDFAGSGESEGDFAADTTLSGWREDLKNVVRWVRSREDFQDSPIMLMGHSLGGYIVLHHEAEGPIAARIALAPVVDLAGNFKSTILGPQCWKQLENNQTITGFYGKGFSLDPAFLPDLLQYPNYLKQELPYATPLLLVHGTGDQAVPAQGSSDIFSRYKGTEKEIHLLDDVDHVFSGHAEAVQSIIRNWVDKILI